MKFGGEYLGHASTEVLAARMVKDHTGSMPKRKGKGSTGAKKTKKRYKGVCYHVGNGSWVAQHGGKTIGGCHTTAEAAAKALELHLTPSQKKKHSALPKAKKTTNEATPRPSNTNVCFRRLAAVGLQRRVVNTSDMQPRRRRQQGW